MNFDIKKIENKTNFGFKKTENKMNFGIKKTENKTNFGIKKIENKTIFGFKKPENTNTKYVINNNIIIIGNKHNNKNKNRNKHVPPKKNRIKINKDSFFLLQDSKAILKISIVFKLNHNLNKISKNQHN